jgi:hypothetical protein
VLAYEGVADIGVSIVGQSDNVEIDRFIMGELKKGLWPSWGMPAVGGHDCGPLVAAAAAAATAIERAKDA